MTSTGSQQPGNNRTSNVLAGIYMLVGIPLLAVATTLLIEALPAANCKVVPAAFGKALLHTSAKLRI